MLHAAPPAAQAKECLAAKLQVQIAAIARVTRGPVGVSIRVVEGGPVVALQGERHFPMQSVYKLPIAIAVLRQVDRGKLRLDQRVRIASSDFLPALRYSPLRDKYPHGAELSVL